MALCLARIKHYMITIVNNTLLLFRQPENKIKSRADRHLTNRKDGDRVFKQPMDLKITGQKTLAFAYSALLVSKINPMSYNPNSPAFKAHL